LYYFSAGFSFFSLAEPIHVCLASVVPLITARAPANWTATESTNGQRIVESMGRHFASWLLHTLPTVSGTASRDQLGLSFVICVYLSCRHLLRRDPPLSAGQFQAEQAILTMTAYEFWEQDNGITVMAAVRNMRERTIEDLNAEFSAANLHM
jgi:hypothetical protein